MNINCGIATVSKEIQFFVLIVLDILMKIPKIMCKTPKITASFILKLLTNCIWFSEIFQMESIPTGKTQSSLTLWAIVDI